MGGCQNYGPFLDPYYNTAPNIEGTRKRTIILTTAHIAPILPQCSPDILNIAECADFASQPQSLRVWGLGFRIQGLGRLGFRVWGLGFGTQGLRFRV